MIKKKSNSDKRRPAGSQGSRQANDAAGYALDLPPLSLIVLPLLLPRGMWVRLYKCTLANHIHIEYAVPDLYHHC
jgi:hypothetical protein